MKFKVSRGRGLEYFLHVENHGDSGSYIFTLDRCFQIRDSMLFSNEVPLTLEQFDESFRGFTGKVPSFVVLESFRQEIERYASGE